MTTVVPTPTPSPVAVLLDGVGAGYAGLDEDGTVREWNAAATALLGWRAADVVGRDLAELVVAPQCRGELRARLREVRAGADPAPSELRALHADGGQLPVEVLLGPAGWPGGSARYAVLRDAGERQVLTRLQEENRLLTAATGALVTQHEPDGRLVYVSPASLHVLGVEPAELLGVDVHGLVHPDDVQELYRREPDPGVPVELALRLRHADGHWVWVEALRTLVRDAAGTVVEVDLSARDVTDRRARDEQSSRESKLESLGRLSAGLAHEINSPIQFVGDNARFLADSYGELLTLIDTYRSLLTSGQPMDWDERVAAVRRLEAEIDVDDLAAEIPGAVEQTLAGIERVATVVRAMKTFSHPGHAEQVYADLNEALTATVTVTRHQVHSVADLQLDLGALPPVRCHVAELNQVFLNLVVNAADAVEDTGAYGSIRVSTAVDGDSVTVSVTDTGGGIPDDVRRRMFDPFFTTKDVGRGSGQGLPLVRSVVQEGHGGTVTVTSEVGVGSTFTLRLPIDGLPARDSA
ncbi:PAS domain S-box protein [Modestobacter sp. I12A-02628]|uniref:histidine kinase n=1 Tax=Goekera deserti TaxID=2497753 RepID=A0A7K3WJQ5_9ACTN|nr:PAS domain S-box protein [Goekera deserti]MPR00520.1 PAS domain S-box protein [Goekera deserti]NDI50456.1 PAS domain S-box protein [Goekera deserti]NEL56552.1 PAS domain S-box protein [Goekera deserti]